MRALTATACATILALAAGGAAAATINLACSGKWRGSNGRPEPLDFSIQFNSSTNELLGYTLWGGTLKTPSEPVIGEKTASEIFFQWLDDERPAVHGILLDRVNGHFLHAETALIDGEPEKGRLPKRWVEGDCKMATPLF